MCDQNTFETLMDYFPGVVVCCHNEPELRVDFASEGFLDLTGYTQSDFLGTAGISLARIQHQEDRQRVWTGIQEALSQQSKFDLSYRIQSPSGEEKWVRHTGRGVSESSTAPQYLKGVLLDITDLKQTEFKIQKQLNHLKALRKIDMMITSSFDLHLTLDVLLQEVLYQLDVDAGCIWLVEPERDRLKYATGRGLHLNGTKSAPIRVGEGFTGQIAMTRKNMILKDSLLGEVLSRHPARLAQEGFISYIGIPLIAKGAVQGVLELFHRRRLGYDREWMEVLESFAGQAAIAIDNATLFTALQRSKTELGLAYDMELDRWVKVLESTGREPKGHIARVSDLTLKLARLLGVPDDHLSDIFRGAVLHDIGTLNIPEAILLKQDPLNPDEWIIVKQHPTYGYDWLTPAPFLRASLDITLYHHEKWDGSGYPQQLAGEKIPLAARIFSVVDVWDILTSERPFRPPWPGWKANEYLQNNAGAHFDTNVVKAFFRMMG